LRKLRIVKILPTMVARKRVDGGYAKDRAHASKGAQYLSRTSSSGTPRPSILNPKQAIQQFARSDRHAKVPTN
jgi:hypothetical protein